MFLDLDGFTMHLRADGPQDAPVLVMLHSLGTDHRVWEPQVAALAGPRCVVRPDLRGHGLTDATADPYTIEGMGGDVLRALDALGIGTFDLAGLSIGGMIAQSIAAAAPDRVRSLVLCDTALAIPPAELWRERAATVRAEGMVAVADAVLARWVTPAFAEAPETRGLRTMLLRTDPEGYAGAAEAIAAADLGALASRIRARALVLVGEEDLATPLEAAEALRDAIAGATLRVVPGASHIPTFERADAVGEIIGDFLRGGCE